ncbi:MAG TPA: hypothetical protein VGP02_17285 [Mycobacteriales bacterium]|jgi:hypothetical protein|nr:hypothetical protein [Mycobacteriales bacterium]
MIILGLTLVGLGLLLETQALWVFGATLVAVGGALALVGMIGRPSQPRSFARWTHPTLG